MKYLLAAFNARPWGMPIAPNWLVLAGVAMLGLLVPPLWLIGAGLEIAYLASLSSSRRFRTIVDAGERQDVDVVWQQRRGELLSQLEPAARHRQIACEARCAELSAQLRRLDGDAMGSSDDDLANLCWLHLRLLVARQAVAAVVANAQHADRLGQQLDEVQTRLQRSDVDEQVRASLERQAEVLRQRLTGQREAVVRLEFVDAELERIAQQVELTREQALLATDATAISQAVNVLSATMGEAGRWLKDQRELLGSLDLGSEAPPAGAFIAAASPSAPRSRSPQ